MNDYDRMGHFVGLYGSTEAQTCTPIYRQWQIFTWQSLQEAIIRMQRHKEQKEKFSFDTFLTFLEYVFWGNVQDFSGNWYCPIELKVFSLA